MSRTYYCTGDYNVKRLKFDLASEVMMISKGKGRSRDNTVIEVVYILYCYCNHDLEIIMYLDIICFFIFFFFRNYL